MQDVVTHNGHPYFISVLQQPTDEREGVTLATQAQAVYVLAVICDGYPLGQQRCLEVGLLDLLVTHMCEQFRMIQTFTESHGCQDSNTVLADNILMLKRVLLALGKLCQDQPTIVHLAHTQCHLLTYLKVCLTLFCQRATANLCFCIGFKDVGFFRDVCPIRSSFFRRG
jgi:hypothetical protein